MKTLIKFASFSLIIFGLNLLLLSSCSTQAQENTATDPDQDSDLAKVTALPPSSKLTLSLCEYVVNPTDGGNGYNRAKANIRKDAGTELTLVQSKISLAFLDQLESQMTHTDDHNCTGYVPAFKITPALDNNKLVFLFQTCFMCTNSFTNCTAADFYTVNASSAYSSCPSGTLAEYADATSHIGYYVANIKFVEAAGTRTFDTSADTRYILLPFQKIRAVINANTGSTAAVFHHFSIKPGAETRQTVLCGPENIDPKFYPSVLKNKFNMGKMVLLGAFSGNFANRSHLCPPACEVQVMIPCSDNNMNCQE